MNKLAIFEKIIFYLLILLIIVFLILNLKRYNISLDECFLQVHNFVKFNSSIYAFKKNTSDYYLQNNKQLFQTYIYSYTKPYLIKLINNSTNS